MCLKEPQKRKTELHMQHLVVSQFKTGLRHLSFCGENSGSYSLLPVRRQGHRHSDLISKKFRSEEKKGDIS